MERRDAFSCYHPLVNFLYFVLVLVFSMFLMHPASLAVSLLGALLYSGQLHGWRQVRQSMRYLLPMLVMAALLNPAFTHKGATILAYLPSGNPLTLESILYGLAAAAMLGTAVLWFSCCSTVLTTDKFIYLFGRTSPALSLLLSMTLRFVPRLKQQLHAVTEAQRCAGRDVSNGSPIRRVQNAVAILSILVTWSLENAIETADSMKSRGYGLPGRTAFSIYQFESRDNLALCWLLFCGIYILYGWASGALEWHYYPLTGGSFSPSFLWVHLALCLTPVILQHFENRQWRTEATNEKANL